MSSDAANGDAPRIEVRGASKTFGANRVLDDVSLVIEPAEIHGLVGQNGSGKSTLIKILTGFHRPDPGMSVAMDGLPLGLPVRWAQAQARGMSVVHQDLGLMDEQTVAENIGIGGFVRSRFPRKIDWRRQTAVAQEVLDRIGLEVDPAAVVGRLSAMERAEVAIARALCAQRAGRGLMILDEATRALPRQELERFHALLRRVVAGGASVLLVSHNLQEVLGMCDRVTVLRDGRVASTAAVPGLSEQEIARTMLGRTVSGVQRVERADGCSGVDAVIDNLAGDRVPPIGFRVGAGEVVGLIGLPGSGFEDVPYLLGGTLPATTGRLLMGDDVLDLTGAGVRRCRRAGVGVLPERRATDGLAMDLSIRDNLSLLSLGERGRPWFLAPGWQKELATSAIRKFDIKANSPGTVARELSGGNQQKVLLAKWMSIAPRLLVLHEPTQAVDVGARADILGAIRRAAAEGTAILFVSIEPTDVSEVCDRILVYRDEGIAEVPGGTTPDDVLDAVYTGSIAKGAVL